MVTTRLDDMADKAKLIARPEVVDKIVQYLLTYLGTLFCEHKYSTYTKHLILVFQVKQSIIGFYKCKCRLSGCYKRN